MRWACVWSWRWMSLRTTRTWCGTARRGTSEAAAAPIPSDHNHAYLTTQPHTLHSGSSSSSSSSSSIPQQHPAAASRSSSSSGRSSSSASSSGRSHIRCAACLHSRVRCVRARVLVLCVCNQRADVYLGRLVSSLPRKVSVRFDSQRDATANMVGRWHRI
jgi:hypothetical protein